MKNKLRGRKWKYVLIVIGIIIILIFIAWLFLKTPKSSGNMVWEPIDLNSENLPEYLGRFTLVHELPESGLIELAVGNNVYTITKGEVAVGKPDRPDIVLTLPASYLEIMGQHGWCAGVQRALADGNLGIEFKESQTELAWKYRSLFSYRKCLG